MAKPVNKAGAGQGPVENPGVSDAQAGAPLPHSTPKALDALFYLEVEGRIRNALGEDGVKEIQGLLAEARRCATAEHLKVRILHNMPVGVAVDYVRRNGLSEVAFRGVSAEQIRRASEDPNFAAKSLFKGADDEAESLFMAVIDNVEPICERLKEIRERDLPAFATKVEPRLQRQNLVAAVGDAFIEKMGFDATEISPPERDNLTHMRMDAEVFDLRIHSSSHNLNQVILLNPDVAAEDVGIITHELTHRLQGDGFIAYDITPPIASTVEAIIFNDPQIPPHLTENPRIAAQRLTEARRAEIIPEMVPECLDTPLALIERAYSKEPTGTLGNWARNHTLDDFFKRLRESRNRIAGLHAEEDFSYPAGLRLGHYLLVRQEQVGEGYAQAFVNGMARGINLSEAELIARQVAETGATFNQARQRVDAFVAAEGIQLRGNETFQELDVFSSRISGAQYQ
ncbi:Uncharacterised protein [uncultured archaeon]|nr:Uncharacterised protein [uncultured archaeon]